MTAVLWIVASIGFHFYLEIVTGSNPVLGALGGGVIVMTWSTCSASRSCSVES